MWLKPQLVIATVCHLEQQLCEQYISEEKISTTPEFIFHKLVSDLFFHQCIK